MVSKTPNSQDGKFTSRPKFSVTEGPTLIIKIHEEILESSRTWVIAIIERNFR